MFAYVFDRLLIILGMVIILPVVLFFGAKYYLSSMETNQGTLNINKISEQSKIYSYKLYSDFFYSATSYDESGREISKLSEIIPTEASIGYDFVKNQIVLHTEALNINRVVVNEQNADKLKIKDVMRDFAKAFAEMVSVQDQYYFDEAFTRIHKINKDVFNDHFDIPNTPNVSDFFESQQAVPISNLMIHPLKLTRIKSNLNGKPYFAPADQWMPNLFKYNFGENDRIYFQYLEKLKGDNIEDIINRDKKSSTTIKTMGYRNGKPETQYFVINNKDNIASAYFNDVNGYVYLLRYRAQNASSFDKFLPDFLKLAFGIYFIDAENFKNWYADEQSKYERNLEVVQQRLKFIYPRALSLTNKRGKNLLEHFGIDVAWLFNPDQPWLSLLGLNEDIQRRIEKPLSHYDGVNQDSIKFLFDFFDKNMPLFDESIEIYYRHSGHHFTGDELKEVAADINLLFEASNRPIIEKLSKTKSNIEQLCKNLKCVRIYKASNWEY